VVDRLLGLRVRIPPRAWMFVLHSKKQKAKCRTIKTQKQVQSINSEQKNKKNPAGSMVARLL
jgi:hypothetical protein